MYIGTSTFEWKKQESKLLIGVLKMGGAGAGGRVWLRLRVRMGMEGVVVLQPRHLWPFI